MKQKNSYLKILKCVVKLKMHQMWLKNVFGSIRPHSEPQNAEQLRIEFVSKKREVKVGGE